LTEEVGEHVTMDWELIKQEYENSSVTLKSLAEKHNVKLGTLKSRKSREGWTRDATLKKDATKKKQNATRKKVATVKPIINSDELTEKQKLFCLYYIKYYNATKAYKKAYGCGNTVASANGSRLLANAKVRKEIERLKAEQQNFVFLDGAAVLQKLIDIAFADITDFVKFGIKEIPVFNVITGEPVFDDEGERVVRTHEFVNILNDEDVDGTLIKKIKQGKEGISIELADKMKALELLAKHFDLFPNTFKRRVEEERLSLSEKKYELDKRIVEMREREEKTKGW
jgi:phage terminase small subunit